MVLLSSNGSGLLQCKEDISFRVPNASFANNLYIYLAVNPCQWGNIFPWPLNLFWFYPLFSIDKTTIIVLVPSSSSADPQNICYFPHICLLVSPSVHSRRNNNNNYYSWKLISVLLIPRIYIQEFPCSQKIIWQYQMLPKNKINAPLPVFPKTLPAATLGQR